LPDISLLGPIFGCFEILLEDKMEQLVQSLARISLFACVQKDREIN